MVCVDAGYWPEEEAGVERAQGSCTPRPDSACVCHAWGRRQPCVPAGRVWQVWCDAQVWGCGVRVGWGSWGGGKQALTPKS